VWVATDDGTLTRFDTRTGQVDGTPVRLPFPAATLAAGHGALQLTGQVEGERRVTAKGNSPNESCQYHPVRSGSPAG
jgi:hypothetical protein